MAKLVWKEVTPYYSSLDERAFFDWLKSIADVVNVIGTPIGLEIYLSEEVSDASLRELIAIYKRYGGDMKELAQLARPENECWFKSIKMYWYADIFGEQVESR